MITYFRNRKMRKHAQECLRHARHWRHMRADVLAAGPLRAIDAACETLRGVLKTRDMGALPAATQAVCATVDQAVPARSHPSLRENLEILVVAVGVAMGFRTYFIQPFKIPTGSMQPTLYGIHSVSGVAPALWDRFPLKLGRWIIFGDWHHTVRAKRTGYLSPLQESKTDPSIVYGFVGGKRHRLPREAANPMDYRLNYRPGDHVPKGAILWQGIRTAGDHVFVDKVRWNFRPPKRGQITVFNTRDIPTLPDGTHYIKRMVGLPGETVAIDAPNLVVDGTPTFEPGQVGRIARREPGYERGFLQAGRMLTADDPIVLGDHQYFCLGDNTGNSRDGRYWGHVPEENLLGPALLVYWPVSRRWGLAD